MGTIHRKSPHYAFTDGDTPARSKYERKRARKARREADRINVGDALALAREADEDTREIDRAARQSRGRGK